MKTIKLLAALCLTLAFGNVNAQSTDSHTIGIAIPPVLLVDIEPLASKNIVMNFTAPTDAGLPITAPDDNDDLWLNYSYIPSTGKTTSKITVSINPVIDGVVIKVQAGAPVGAGGGTRGSLTGSAVVTLSTDPADLITTIGASYTGDGSGNGHQLTYSAVAAGSATYDDLIQVDAASNTTIVTYTIVEN